MNNLPYKSVRLNVSEQSATEMDSPIEMSDVQGLIHSLETEFKDIWTTFETQQPIGEVRDFGHHLENLGKRHKAEVISSYGDELVMAANSFNIEAILSLVWKYPRIVDLLKDDLNNATKNHG